MMKSVAMYCGAVVGAVAVSAQQGDEAGRFRDCGVAANVAEARGAVVCTTGDGRSLAIVNGLDSGSRAYVVVVDIDTEKTQMVYAPDSVRQAGAFGSMLSANGRFYTGRGRVLLEFDPDRMAWTFAGVPSPKSGNIMSFAESPRGRRIWAALHPTCALVSYDPETRTAEEMAILDPEQDYPQSLALDDQGWVYAGIGTARCNLVGYHPESGEIRQLLPEELRTHGTGVVAAGQDGSVTGTAAGRHYRLHGGTATPYAGDEQRPARTPVGSVYYGRHLRHWPDGRELLALDLPEKRLVVGGPEGDKRIIELEYDCGGASLTSVAAGPAGNVYASSSHPMHLVRLNPGTGEITDLGGVPRIGGGNFCSMATDGVALYGAEYAGGRLWRYDPEQPWNPGSASRTINGIPADKLVADGEAEKGHFSYLKSLDLAFFRGDEFGAKGAVALEAPEDGAYFVEFVPFQYHTYSRVQFGFNDEQLGDPFDPATGTEGAGPHFSYGPFDLRAGVHRLSLQPLKTGEREPWCSLVTARLRKAEAEKTPLVTEQSSNPEVLAQWKQDVCRPRAALFHPDGDHVLMAGFAGYGLCGGGIGIYRLSDGQARLLRAETDLVDGLSGIALAALGDGTVVVGTSIRAPGGGRQVAAESELLMLEWPSARLLWHGTPVPGEADVVALVVARNGKVYGVTGGGILFEFDPAIKTVSRTLSVKAYGSVPRHAFQTDSNGTIYLLMRDGILTLDPDEMTVELMARPPVAIRAGGAWVDGKLCFAAGAHLWTYAVPPAP